MFADYALDLLETGPDHSDKDFLTHVAKHINDKAKVDGKATGMLHNAVKLKQNDLIRLLLESGFDPNEVDKNGTLNSFYGKLY